MAARAAAKAIDTSAPHLHVSLFGLPRTALPNDVRRLCGKSKVENVTHASIYYMRFKPTGGAILSFARPEYATAAAKTLQGTVLGGKKLKAHTIDMASSPRRRGKDGLSEAIERGIITGSGPDGGITSTGKSVVLYGIPGRMTSNHLANALRDFKVAGADQGKPVVVKIDKNDKAAATSRFFIRLDSVSEAYRLVRKLHMQHFQPEYYATKYVARAFVIS